MSVPHQHALFGELLLEDDHHDGEVAAIGHHHDLNAGRGEGATAPAGTQSHHHGDTGASLVILGSQPLTLVERSEQRQDIAFVRFAISVRQVLPERPPRTASSAV